MKYEYNDLGHENHLHRFYDKKFGKSHVSAKECIEMPMIKDKISPFDSLIKERCFQVFLILMMSIVVQNMIKIHLYIVAQQLCDFLNQSIAPMNDKVAYFKKDQEGHLESVHNIGEF